MKAAVPREIVDACGGLEKDHRRARGNRLTPRHLTRYTGNLKIIQPADKSTFDALGEKFVKIHSTVGAGSSRPPVPAHGVGKATERRPYQSLSFS